MQCTNVPACFTYLYTRSAVLMLTSMFLMQRARVRNGTWLCMRVSQNDRMASRASRWTFTARLQGRYASELVCCLDSSRRQKALSFTISFHAGHDREMWFCTNRRSDNPGKLLSGFSPLPVVALELHV
jgi:hypothetical protein